jgi:hexosaminidase
MIKPAKNRKFLFISLASVLVLLLIATGILLGTGILSKENFGQPASSNIQVLDPASVILPKPVECIQNPGAFTITKKTAIYVNGNGITGSDELMKIGQYLADIIKPSTGYNPKIVESSKVKSGSIYLTIQEEETVLGNEGYQGRCGIFTGVEPIRWMQKKLRKPLIL